MKINCSAFLQTDFSSQCCLTLWQFSVELIHVWQHDSVSVLKLINVLDLSFLRHFKITIHGEWIIYYQQKRLRRAQFSKPAVRACRGTLSENETIVSFLSFRKWSFLFTWFPLKKTLFPFWRSIGCRQLPRAGGLPQCQQNKKKKMLWLRKGGSENRSKTPPGSLSVSWRGLCSHWSVSENTSLPPCSADRPIQAARQQPRRLINDSFYMWSNRLLVLYCLCLEVCYFLLLAYYNILNSLYLMVRWRYWRCQLYNDRFFPTNTADLMFYRQINSLIICNLWVALKDNVEKKFVDTR